MNDNKLDMDPVWQPEGRHLDFDVHVDLLLATAKQRSEQEYNSWLSMIGTFVEAIENHRDVLETVRNDTNADLLDPAAMRQVREILYGESPQPDVDAA